MEPSSNISDKELFKVNGQLPPERIEKLLNTPVIGQRQVQELRAILHDGKSTLVDLCDDLEALQKTVRGDNMRKVYQILRSCQLALDYVNNAKDIVE